MITSLNITKSFLDQDNIKSNQIKNYNIQQKNANRLFVVSYYIPDNKGELHAPLPDTCPLNFEDKKSCKIYFDHYRDRKTGPQFPLSVVRCLTHKKAFTIYPPGFTPYGRRPLVSNLAPDGNCIIPEKDQNIGKTELECFSDTYFDAAIDAANRKAWPKEYDVTCPDLRFNTQLDHIYRAVLITGLDRSLPIHVSEKIGAVLGVDGQTLNDSKKLIQQNSGYKTCGRAVCDVLKELSYQLSPYECLLESGYLAGLWSKPFLWNNKNLVDFPFHKFGIRASPV